MLNELEKYAMEKLQHEIQSLELDLSTNHYHYELEKALNVKLDALHSKFYQFEKIIDEKYGVKRK